MAAEVPRADTYSLGYIAALLPSAWDIFKNTIGLLDIVEEREATTPARSTRWRPMRARPTAPRASTRPGCARRRARAG